MDVNTCHPHAGQTRPAANNFVSLGQHETANVAARLVSPECGVTGIDIMFDSKIYQDHSNWLRIHQCRSKQHTKII